MQEGKKEFFNVTFSHGDNGQLVATNANRTPFSAGKADKDSIITFTTTPNQNYVVDTWTITGGVTTEGGNAGDQITKVKVTGDVNVKVTFRDPLYTRVIFSQLDEYLTNIAKENEVNHIVIFELKETDVMSDDKETPSPLAAILTKHPTKRVAIKFGCDLPAITSLKYCFNGCKNLIEAPVIPASVKNVIGAFYDCTNLTKAPKLPSGITAMVTTFYNCAELTEAPEIPKSVVNMAACFAGCVKLIKMPEIPAGVKRMDRAFNDTFNGCTSLENNGIKVPTAEFAKYRTNATKMGTTQEKIVAI
ncbi:MAG: leucine-rich repeat protein [Treponema sp.]